MRKENQRDLMISKKKKFSKPMMEKKILNSVLMTQQRNKIPKRLK